MKKFALIDVLLLLTIYIQYNAFILASRQNSTTEDDESFGTQENKDETLFKNGPIADDNKTLHNLVEEIYDKQFYNLSTCKDELKNNLGGNFNLSLHDFLYEGVYKKDNLSVDSIKDNKGPLCFVDNTRDSGTDLINSVLLKTKTVDAESCQTRCQFSEGCNYFLYLTKDHPQWYKRRECRLLSHTGTLVNKEHHVSGPKHCNLTKNYTFVKESNDLVDLNRTFLESNIFQLTSGKPNLTSHQNITILVDDFLTQICRFQVFSGIRCQYLIVCPRGSCVGDDIPTGWYEQNNCCTYPNQTYQWVLPHEDWKSSGRNVYEPCIVNRANEDIEFNEQPTETFRSDKSMSQDGTKQNDVKVEDSTELLSDAGKKIINQHIDSYIKNKTIEISPPANETAPIKATVSSLISVSGTETPMYEERRLCLLQGEDAISTDCSVEIVATSTGNVSVCICKDKQIIDSSASNNKATSFFFLILLLSQMFCIKF